MMCVPSHVQQPARVQSRALRIAGDSESAMRILQKFGAAASRDPRDLVELLLVQQSTDQYASPRERLRVMQHTIAHANMTRPRVAYNVLLSACAREAVKTSDNSAVKRDVILETARNTWNELIAMNGINPRAASLMYAVCGECKELALARRIRHFLAESTFVGDETTVAAYMLCLGKCGRATEAEQLYFSPENIRYRGSDAMLVALFRAFVTANKITKAEALISMYGSNWLNINCCNTFVKQCAQLRMYDTAMHFVNRMNRGAQFPPPTANTYNLLLRGLSVGTGAEDRDVAADRAMLLVKEMKEQKIEPTTVTYNTLIRSFIFRDQIEEALQLFSTMENPNRITFSHLMLGASKTCDLALAKDLLSWLFKAKTQPNYGFCKSYLAVVARVKGVNFAFEEAKRLSTQFGDVLMFGDVGSREAIRMALINACGQVGDLPAAFDALKTQLGTEDDSQGNLAPLYVGTVIMQVCIQCNALGRALEVFKSLKASGLKPNFEVYESLIYGLSSYARKDADEREREQKQRELVSMFSGDEFDREDGAEGKWNDPKSSHFHMRRRRAHNSEIERQPESPSPQECISLSVELLREMHINGIARLSRQAAYIYNTLIAASASIGNFELSLQIFNKMCRQSNSGVVYVPYASPSDAKAPEIENSQQNNILHAIVSTGMFENEFQFPTAAVGTYNSIIYAAWRCGQADFCFEIFDIMQIDRTTEPNAATLSLLADIVLGEASISVERMTKVLKALDRMPILSKAVAGKRVRMRQKLLALRWSA